MCFSFRMTTLRFVSGFHFYQMPTGVWLILNVENFKTWVFTLKGRESELNSKVLKCFLMLEIYWIWNTYRYEIDWKVFEVFFKKMFRFPLLLGGGVRGFLFLRGLLIRIQGDVFFGEKNIFVLNSHLLHWIMYIL